MSEGSIWTAVQQLVFCACCCINEPEVSHTQADKQCHDSALSQDSQKSSSHQQPNHSSNHREDEYVPSAPYADLVLLSNTEQLQMQYQKALKSLNLSDMPSSSSSSSPSSSIRIYPKSGIARILFASLYNNPKGGSPDSSSSGSSSSGPSLSSPRPSNSKDSDGTIGSMEPMECGLEIN